jgi:hypothetical protein
MATVNAGTVSSKRMVHTETRRPIEAVSARIVYYFFGVVEVLLAARFSLLLLSANPDSAFVAFVYNVSGFFAAPFNAIFKTQSASSATIEWSTLVAIGVYALVAWGIVSLVFALSPRRSVATFERVQEVDDSVS